MRTVSLCLLSTLGLSGCLACHSAQTPVSAELPAATKPRAHHRQRPMTHQTSVLYSILVLNRTLHSQSLAVRGPDSLRQSLLSLTLLLRALPTLPLRKEPLHSSNLQAVLPTISRFPPGLHRSSSPTFLLLTLPTSQPGRIIWMSSWASRT